jgi:hypothetical protein
MAVDLQPRALAMPLEMRRNFGFGFGNRNIVQVFWISVSGPNFGKTEILLHYAFSNLKTRRIENV